MADTFEVLNDIEHTLRRPSIMIGSVVEQDLSMYINGKYTTMRIVPGLLVITREIIDNCIDEFIRSKGTAANKISITMTPMSLTVEDNGRGIPVEKYVNEANNIDEWRPVLCWTKLKAGTSFSNHDKGPSANGVGASVANILSLYFSGETWDGKKYCRVQCRDNMSDVKINILDESKHPTGTKVIIEPDFKRFGVECYSKDHIIATRDRIVALSSVYPEITFVFNGEKIKTRKPKEYLSMYGDKYVSYESENYFFAVFPTEVDEYYEQSVIDGLYIKNGGTHEAVISRELAYALKDIIKKKHKLEMSPAEIKRGFCLIFNARLFPNMKFDSQTKEKLINSEAEVKEYFGQIPYDKLAKEIFAVSEIIDPIIETKLAKQIAAEKRAVTLEQKKLAKKNVEKHIPAKSRKREETTLYLVEGDSALGSGIKVRDVNTMGFFPLRGLPMNTYGESEASILGNKELNNVMSILDVRFPEYYSIILDNGEEVIASNNDDIFINGKWVSVSSLISNKAV